MKRERSRERISLARGPARAPIHSASQPASQSASEPASQPASQPAKLSLLSFPILILFLPGRSGRHISRSGHKIHSPFQSPFHPLDRPTPFPFEGRETEIAERELPLFARLSSSSLVSYFPSYSNFPFLPTSPCYQSRATLLGSIIN